MAAAANRANPSIEFIVKPKDDLFLHGLERTLPRVSKGIVTSLSNLYSFEIFNKAIHFFL
jgi:hypothetical protein